MKVFMKNSELEKYINTLLDAPRYNDMCPNGLQVEGNDEVKKIITGVSACVDLFDEAIKRKADAIIVHHGIIWNFERPLYKGGYKERVKKLLDHNINLFGYHLPLDGDLKFGNNALIAGILEAKDIQPFNEYKGVPIGCSARFDNLPAKQLFEKVKEKINTNAIIFPDGADQINSIGIISGGAQKEVKNAVLQGMDAFLTGEVSEHIYHYAREEGIHFIAAGHHATEVFGVHSLGQHLAATLDLDVEFVNIHNPV